jgi:BirA family biotin operon repressor/biotin-[acetyl-CoA-carboxylase] ligase
MRSRRHAPQGWRLYLAEHQKAGQGRMGRAWYPRPPRQPGDEPVAALRVAMPMMSGLSLVVGIAIADALALDGLGLKWPNDLSATAASSAASWSTCVRRPKGGPGCDAVIGIGLNLSLPDVSAIDQPWTDLVRCGAPPRSRNMLVAHAAGTACCPRSHASSRGTRALPRQLAAAGRARRPAKVRVLDGDRVHEGRLDGITASGALRLRKDGEECIFHSGEVSLRTA